VSGEPLKRAGGVVWTKVMNTQEQLRLAFEELSEGTFLNPKI